MKNALIIGLTKSKKLAKRAAEHLEASYHEPEVKQFADGELWVKVDATVRNKYVYIVQSTSAPANDSLMELLITMDAVKRAGAAYINVVMPYYGYARQDRKNKGRQPITSKLVADMLTSAGASRVVTIDLHAQQIQGFFNIPVDHIKGTNYIAKQLREYEFDNPVIVSPDHGAMYKTKEFAAMLGKGDVAVINKERTGHNQAQSNFLLGSNVEGRDVIIVDDMVDTGGTIAAAVEKLKESGANKVYVVATHAVLSGNEDNPKAAFDRLRDSGVEKFYTTNTIEKGFEDELLHVMDLYKVISNFIKINEAGESVSDYIDTWN